ncbi:MAG: ABC transporter ATP-binding protein [Bacteroidetes bacterium]|nr:ABC transporter ATP-binding protein [Bacteroidota bacterium]
MITGTHIKKAYGSLEVLKGFDFKINMGEVAAIVGPSGAGKSTLLHIIGTIDTPDSGEVFFNGENITKRSSAALAKFRNKHIGFVFQFHHLLPEFTALENVCIPAYIAGLSKAEASEKAMVLLKRLGLATRVHHKPNALSGGEQQRVAVARALVNNPSVILADEPSGNLDSENAKQLHQLFFELRDEFNQTFVIVTHNDELAAMANRRLSMRDGYIVEDSSNPNNN